VPVPMPVRKKNSIRGRKEKEKKRIHDKAAKGSKLTKMVVGGGGVVRAEEGGGTSRVNKEIYRDGFL